ncbi:killer cell immunoglobulin-like receptor 3DL2 [Dasypus novemcinctus]|uniref:killer cell immunoglobulin-like receptor 3DL2 n=1 Tax=Dasypus novemcinctus TaxID=9361 RepID=UPI00265EEA97|nr:killer cell immunoglobulin-like receptor 3DL2 [Dasypus novemcinctus]
MFPKFISLLCVGLSLGQRIWAQKDSQFHQDTSKLNILSGLLVFFITIGIFFLILICHWCSTKNRRRLPRLLTHSPTNDTIIDKELKEDQIMDGNDTEAEGLPEVIYAQLNHWTLTERGDSPTSQSHKYFSDDPSIYIELPTRQASAELMSDLFPRP